MWLRGTPANLRELEYFFTEFGELLTAGIDLEQALKQLHKLPSRIGMNLFAINAALRKGQALDEVFLSAGFPDFVMPFLQIGLTTGELGEAMQQLSGYLNRRRKYRERLWKISAYPLFLAVLSMVTIYTMSWQVLPSYLRFYQSLHLHVPALVSWLIQITMAVVHIIPFMIATAGVIGVSVWMTRSRLQPKMESWIVHRKGGELLRTIKAAQSFSTLSALLGAGIDLLSSLHVLIRTNTASMRKEWQELLLLIEKGASLSSAINHTAYLPELASAMLMIAEQTGDLENGTKRVARHFESVLERMLERFFAVLEPLSLVILGIVVGGATLLLLVPMTDLVKQLA